MFFFNPLLFYLCGIIVSMLKFFRNVKTNSESQSFVGFLKDLEYNKDFFEAEFEYMAISMLEAPELDFWLSVVFIATSPCLAS
jgi:hypothetical protein